ncbi:MAG: hypothetical protein RL538_829 [Candidatus Parcubacteria bacterium]|jgi:hypothetical protein
MLDKKHIETILKINGIGETAPDEQVRSVLLSARFNADEVETALMILRENTKTNKTRVDGLHKVFRTDQSLDASEISSLLGVEVNFTDKVTVQTGINAKRFTIIQVIILWAVSFIIATTALLFYMYSHEMGVFHPSSDIVLKK